MHKIHLPADIVSGILNTAADATIISDSAGFIRVVNQRAEELFGYGPGELIGRQVEILLPDDFRDRHRELRTKYNDAPRARPMVSGLDLSGVRSDGSTIRVDIALNPIETNDGLIVASTIREITGINDSEAYFRTILESAPDAMIIIDDRGKIAVVNGQAESMFGYTRDEMLGQPIEMLLPERLREQHVQNRNAFNADPRLRPMGAGLDLLARRKSTQPIGLPSCGSVFRNPKGDHAARLIEQAGLKGTQIGGARVSDMHANFIINTGDATAADVETLIETVRERIAQKFGIELVHEVRIVGRAA